MNHRQGVQTWMLPSGILTIQPGKKAFHFYSGNKHDVIGIRVYDKMDMQLPNAGLLRLSDAETGNIKLVDSSNPMVRYNYQQHFFKQTETCTKYFRKAGADLLHVRTDEDYVKVLQKFFLKRK